MQGRRRQRTRISTMNRKFLLDQKASAFALDKVRCTREVKCDTKVTQRNGCVVEGSLIVRLFRLGFTWVGLL